MVLTKKCDISFFLHVLKTEHIFCYLIFFFQCLTAEGWVCIFLGHCER
jgi:hypothetical protein